MTLLEQLRLFLVSISLILIVNSSFAQTGPGGVGNKAGLNGQPSNKLWLKADQATTISSMNSPVNIWTDYSGNNNNATQPIVNQQPLYQVNVINGKPVLRFDGLSSTSGGDFLKLPALLAQNNYTTFIIARTSLQHQIDTETNQLNVTTGTLGQRYIIGATNTGTTSAGSGISLGNNGVSVYEHGNAYMPPLAVHSGAVNNFNNITLRYNAKQPSIFLNGKLVRTGLISKKNGNIYAGASLGGDNLYGNFSGDIAEVILFDQALNAAQRNIVDNYLSSKYAIATAKDKYRYDAANQYGNQLAGIGREDMANQHTAASSAIVTISNATSLGDGDYLFFGNNGGSMQLTNTDAPASMKRLNSVWQTLPIVQVL